MSPRDLVYVGHMLDMARKAVTKTARLSRKAYDADGFPCRHQLRIVPEARGRACTTGWPRRGSCTPRPPDLIRFSI